MAKRSSLSVVNPNEEGNGSGVGSRNSSRPGTAGTGSASPPKLSPSQVGSPFQMHSPQPQPQQRERVSISVPTRAMSVSVPQTNILTLSSPTHQENDEKNNLFVERFTNNEVLTSLWNKNATEKCRVGLADAIIYESGLPVRWYVTGKTGEVTKKRGVDLNAVSQRWLKINAQTENSPAVAIIRQNGGILKFLTIDAWQNFIADIQPDNTVQSIHCFIDGENHNVYRNKFTLKDKLGRYSSTTHTYSFKLDRNNTQSVTTMYQNQVKLVESKAHQVRNILDLATNTVVRYMELMMKIKIINISLDFVIDRMSQIWLLWASDCSFVRAANLSELSSIPTSSIVDKSGRMSWAGDKYFETVRDGEFEERRSSPSPTSSPKRSTMSRETNSSYFNGTGSSSYNPDASSHSVMSANPTLKAESEIASAQINSAVNVSNPLARGSKTALYNVIPNLEKANAPENKFPQAYKCKGDYCKFLLQSNGETSTHQQNLEAQHKLFSEKEIDLLGRDGRFKQMMSFFASGKSREDGFTSITMKSIILARQERRGFSVADNSQPWASYPSSPRSRIAFIESMEALNAESKNSEIAKQKMIEKVLIHDKEQRESFTKTMANYYEQVHVCSVCQSVYLCLDWARDVLGRGDAYGAGIEGLGAAHPRDKDKKPKRDRSRLLSSSTDSVPQGLTHSSSLSAMPSYAAATVNSVSSQAPPRKETSPSRGGSRKGKRVSSHNQEVDNDFRRSWKDHLPRDSDGKPASSAVKVGAAAPAGSSKDGPSFVGMDDYLRGGSEALAKRKMQEQLKMAKSTDSITTEITNSLYHGEVLLACDQEDVVKQIVDILEEAQFRVHVVRDGREAVNDFVLKEKGFDCVLVQRDLRLNDAFKVTEGVREYEKILRKKAALFAATEGKGIQPPTRRHPVVCVTSATTPQDLKSYMHADMDGCVSLPINKVSLLSTVRASIPHHLAVTTSQEVNTAMFAQKTQTAVYKLGNLGELEGSTDSATMAAKTLPIGGGPDDDVAFNGVVQIDADTRVPFIVMDASKTAKVLVNQNKPFFNLVVCHDMFDTAERMKIFLRPMIQRYLGMQVLLWNYPGQAFTEWREEQLLNNEYLAACLNEVLGQVGEKGTRDFDTSKPFYVMGYGLGASVASFYASHYRVPNLRGLLNVNGWSFLDSYLAGIMHDCINIFNCSPPTRPDLPVYFFSRFLFSKEYLAKVSVPLALNIYTAVHNSISLKGRLGLCKGVLQLVDVRPLLKEIDCPVICIHSTQDALSRPMHSEPFASHRSGEVRSIHKVLRNPQKTCIIWMKGGHEVFQENKKQTQLIIEQILTGFHESHDVSFPAGSTVDPTSTTQGKLISSLPWENKTEKTVEDKFIDNVLGNVNKLRPSSHEKRTGSPLSSSLNNTRAGSPNFRPGSSEALQRSGTATGGKRHSSPSGGGGGGGGAIMHSGKPSSPLGSPGGVSGKVSLSTANDADWARYSQLLSESQVVSKTKPDAKKGGKKNKNDPNEMTEVMDPTSTKFGTIQKASQIQQNIHEYPEVKEFMSWRLKRNKKRLQRLQGAARIIQGAFRAHIARKFVHGIRRFKAALFIQRVFRGYRGRYAFQRRARRIWAAQILQRSWRGYTGRKWYFIIRVRIAAAVNIQRVFRGGQGRTFVNKLKRKRYLAASVIQAMGRRYIARRDAWRRRQFRNSSTSIQRIFRGLLGRKRALAERNKYIFSRSQSQGIEFGRQMLLEHKLHATKLQSDVTLLTQEKVGAEEQIEALLEEISSFEEGVRTLEKEMHQLSKVESEASAFMDEDSKFELREQKIKLDREFGEMLSKIGNRKDMLNDLERKLSTIDKSRQAKEEELRTLERKLVVLLEEQQNELNAIKRKQDVRGAMLAASHDELMKVTGGESSTVTRTRDGTSGGGGGGGGHSGPSLQEKKQAAQLMQSTETLMKFGFMSMSMTYFSSLNMIKALRTVSAQDTVMAALADVHAQRAVGHGLGGIGGGGGSTDDSMSKSSFLPDLKPGQAAGQQVLRVSAWSVDDVSKWLQTLSLGQYSEAFIDSAVDGEFLYDLNDDDLKNTLGIEHRLHRKKILNCVHRLKLAEAQRDSRLNDLLRDGGGLEAPTIAPDADPQAAFGNPFANGEGGMDDEAREHIDGPKIPLSELFSLVRHSKFSLIKDAIDYLPNKTFDTSLVQAGYVVDHGTVYLAGYERLPFHVNKTDEYGNTMLSLACQNGNAKICKYLLAKGANPNHQNKMGQTPAHFAIAYKFFDLSNWLFENGASDLIENKFGLSPYDGLSAEGGDEILAIEG